MSGSRPRALDRIDAGAVVAERLQDRVDDAGRVEAGFTDMRQFFVGVFERLLANSESTDSLRDRIPPPTAAAPEPR